MLDMVKLFSFLDLNHVRVARSLNCVRKYEVSYFQFIACYNTV